MKNQKEKVVLLLFSLLKYFIDHTDSVNSNNSNDDDDKNNHNKPSLQKTMIIFLSIVNSNWKTENELLLPTLETDSYLSVTWSYHQIALSRANMEKAAVHANPPMR